MQGSSIEQKIADVREWIRAHRRGDNPKPILWTLHYDSSIHKINKSSPRLDSYLEDIGDNDESVFLLENAIRRASNQPHKFLMVTLRTATKDPDPLLFTFENPNAAGVHGQQQMYPMGGGFDTMGFMQQMFAQQIGYITQMNEIQRKADMERFRMEQERKELKQEIESTQNAKVGFIDKIASQIPWELVIEKFLGGSGESEIEQETAEHSGDNTPTDEEYKRAIQQRLANDLNRIKGVFKDVHVFVHELANFVESDPKNASFYRGMMKKNNSGD